MLPSAASQFGSSDFYLPLEHPDHFELTYEVIHQYLNYFHAQHAHKMLTANLGCLYLDAIYRTASTPPLHTPEMFITLFVPACHLRKIQVLKSAEDDAPEDKDEDEGTCVPARPRHEFSLRLVAHPSPLPPAGKPSYCPSSFPICRPSSRYSHRCAE